MKQWSTILLACLCGTAQAQLPASRITARQLPAQLSHTGKLTKAYSWNDSAGAHYVLATETGLRPTPGDNGNGSRDASLFVYHYVLDAGKPRLLWKVQDGEQDCPVDLLVRFLADTLQVTDLNGNGTPEVWMSYEVQCTGDVSPTPRKIIMYEGNRKYALRGTARVNVGNNHYLGGSYVFDENFRSGDARFRKYAAALWQRIRIQRWGS